MRLHGSCVVYKDRAVLIVGKSGSGKSALALQLMAYGAELVGDDQLMIRETDGGLMVEGIEPIQSVIEARYFGLLKAEPRQSAYLVMMIDLDHIETKRLPPERQQQFYTHAIPVFHKVETEAFPAAILQYLKGGKAIL